MEIMHGRTKCHSALKYQFEWQDVVGSLNSHVMRGRVVYNADVYCAQEVLDKVQHFDVYKEENVIYRIPRPNTCFGALKTEPQNDL